jgi:hypothetical protein
MVQRSVSIAWKVYLGYGIYLAALGLLMLVMPCAVSVGQFESFTGATWVEFAEANAEAGDFIGLVFRHLGCMALLVGIFKIFIGLYPYRKAEAWSWWTALIIGVIAYGFILPYGIIVGDIATLFINIIGVVLFLIAIVMPARVMLSKKP